MIILWRIKTNDLIKLIIVAVFATAVGSYILLTEGPAISQEPEARQPAEEEGVPEGQMPPEEQIPEEALPPLPPETLYHTITIQDGAFKPSVLEIKKGKTVTWLNKDSVFHTVTVDKTFDSGIIPGGRSFYYLFEKTGTFNYACTLHSSEEGQIIVSD